MTANVKIPFESHSRGLPMKWALAVSSEGPALNAKCNNLSARLLPRNIALRTPICRIAALIDT